MGFFWGCFNLSAVIGSGEWDFLLSFFKEPMEFNEILNWRMKLGISSLVPQEYGSFLSGLLSAFPFALWKAQHIGW